LDQKKKESQNNKTKKDKEGDLSVTACGDWWLTIIFYTKFV